MPNPDLAIYAVHGAFWTSFGVTRAVVRAREGRAPAPAVPAPVATTEATAPHSRAVLAVHAIAFGVMYWGLGTTVLPGVVPEWFYGQRVAGVAVMAAGAALMSWSLVYFQSWRFRAKLDAGHQLATGGPYHFLRHPIYMGLNLLALGTAVWDPAPGLWVAVGFMVLGSDLRGRAEERLLAGVFGTAYLEYCATTKRFLPGIY